MNALVRKAMASDAAGITELVTVAFPGIEGREIDELVSALWSDVTAAPPISLVAEIQSRVVGHILFTGVRLEESPMEVTAQILAPLSVHPDFQGRGIGGSLIEEGLRAAKEAGTELVFVLGHPAYYPRHGFVVAGRSGFDAPYPIAEADADAWMVQELRPGVIGESRGRVTCAESLMDAKHWRA